MGFVEDDDVVEAIPTDRADQSLDVRVLPRRTRSDGGGWHWLCQCLCDPWLAVDMPAWFFRCQSLGR